MSIDPTTIPRYAHGSRVPGWDDAVDLDQGPRRRPRPRDDAGARRPARGDRGRTWPRYPDRRSAAIPALRRRAAALHGWCSPEAIEQVACVMRLTPAYLIAVATLLRHARDAARSGADTRLRVHEHLLLAARRRRAARARCRGRRRRRPRRQRARLRVPRRVRHRADGLGRRRLRRPGRASTRSPSSPAADPRRRAAAARPSSSRRAGADPGVDPKAGRRADEPTSSCSPTSTSPASTRSRSTSAAAATQPLRKALHDAAARRSSRSSRRSGLRGRGGAGFSMGMKASFLPKGDDGQVPRRATRTSPSRARSRTAS